MFGHAPFGLIKAVLDGMPYAAEPFEVRRVETEIIGLLCGFDNQRIRYINHGVLLFPQPCGLEDRVACPGGDFLRAMEIDSDELVPARSAIVSNRALFLYLPESGFLKHADQLGKFHALL